MRLINLSIFLSFPAFNLWAYERKILSQEQQEQYKRDGYIVLRNLLTPDEKADVTQIMDEMQSWPHSDDKWFTYYEKVNGKHWFSLPEQVCMFFF